MVRSLIYIYTVLFTPLIHAYNHSSLYTIQDLEILVKQKNYKEFLLHTHDLRPSLRTTNWKQLTRKSGLGFINQEITRNHFDNISFKFIEELSTWQTLRDDELFQIKREDYFQHYILSCIKTNKPSCLIKLDSFWNSSTKNPNLAANFLSIKSKYFKDQSLWPYIKIILNSNLTTFYCSKNNILKVVMERLNVIYIKNKGLFDRKLRMQNLANQECWKSIIPFLKTTITKSTNPIDTENAYQALQDLNQLQPHEKDLFLVLFILKNPIKGEVLNLSWNTLEEMKEDFPRRESLITRLKVMDPLPDQLFGSPDIYKKRILIDFLHQNIPEYLTLYAQTCIDYYYGNREFPNGNPALHCSSLFKFANGRNWINHQVLMKYKNRPQYKKNKGPLVQAL
jgi:hypothetical protein